MEKFTSDGIKISDWKILESLAQNYVDMIEKEDAENYRRKILVYLNKLQKKYGDKSSILATKADYVKSIALQDKLLGKAYIIAKYNKDYKNLVLISSSLIDLYMEEMFDEDKIKFWILELAHNLEKHTDIMEFENLKRWRKLYNI